MFFILYVFFMFFFFPRVSWGPRREETCPSPLIHSLRRRSAYSVHSHASHLRRSRLESQKNMPSRRSSKRKELKERYLKFEQPFIDLFISSLHNSSYFMFLSFVLVDEDTNLFIKSKEIISTRCHTILNFLSERKINHLPMTFIFNNI